MGHLVEMIAKGKYVPGTVKNASSQLKDHIKYIQYRTRLNETREDRYIFGKESNHIDRKTAQTDVHAHTSSKVSFHKIILSPSKEEYITDWQGWTRQVMNDLEQRLEKNLHWYAVVHNNTEHSHVHVILAGGTENPTTGKTSPVPLYQQDYQFLRESGREHSELEFYKALETSVQELDARDDTIEPLQQKEHSRA